jgi:hypothetical protein
MTGATATTIEGDVNGDGVADLQIILKGVFAVDVTGLILV